MRHILSTLVQHGFLKELGSVGLKRHLSPGAVHSGERVSENARRRDFGSGGQARAAELRSAIEGLGGIFPTLGRLLSLRPDVLPVDYVEEFSKLREAGQTAPTEQVVEVIENELNRSLDAVFERFDETPTGVVGLAQVHRAELKSEFAESGFTDVDVVVIKPGLDAMLREDLAALDEMTALVSQSRAAAQLDLPRLRTELEESLRATLDLQQIAHDRERLRKMTAEFGRLRVPRIVATLSTERVLVSEHVSGETRDPSTLLGRKDLADQLWRALLKQILIEGSFLEPSMGDELHIDEGDRAVLTAPTGLIHLSRETQLRLMLLLIALSDGDGDRAGAAFREMGTAGREFNEQAFSREVGQVVSRFRGRSPGETALALAELSMRHDIRFPPEVIHLGETLSGMERVIKGLDPKMEPMMILKETATAALNDQISRELQTTRLLSLALEIRSFLSDAPSNMRRFLSRAATNGVQLGVRLEESDVFENAVRKLGKYVTLGLISAALIVGSALMLQVDSTPKLLGYPAFALSAFLAATGLGLYVVVRILRGRL
jgi:predicted unusual protein kinase regulating ubiquinone biosynthesis (AarF/ABC1/UbiB family)